MRLRAIAVACLAAVALTGCGPRDGSSPTVTVYAAASLRDAFEALAGRYEEEHGAHLVFAFDASSALRTQIELGAPAELFASADVTTAQRLVDAGLTEGGVRVFATNRLAIVAAAHDESAVTRWQELAMGDVRIVAAGEDVPITRYARELVDALGAATDAPDDFAASYDGNVVSREDNVRATLAKVELGEADAAIVYATDAAASDAVRALPLPAEVDVAAEYALVTTDGAPAAARQLADWLLGWEAQAILRSFGFEGPQG